MSAAVLSSFARPYFWLVIATLCSFSLSDGSLGRGFGDHIDWKTYPQGLKEAQTSHKPIMVLIHKTWCGACKALKPKFARSEEIEELSKNFVMINLEDDEEPEDIQFYVDGTYIPRIFILDSTGKVQKDIYNKKGNPSHKYYYGNTKAIVKSMKEALELLTDGVRVGDEL